MNRTFTKILLYLIFILHAVIASGADCRGFEVRIVRDMAELSFPCFEKQRDEVWALARITPGTRKSELPGYIDGKTGRLVGSTVGADLPAFTGTCRVSVLLTGTLRRLEWSYRFTEHPYGHDLESQTPYSPLESGGAVVCGLKEDSEGADRFLRLFLIPPEWERYILPAWKYYSSHETLFQPGKKPLEINPLVKLFGDENPFLAFSACRTLCEFRSVSDYVVQLSLERQDRIRTATMVYLFLTEADHDQSLEVIRDLDWTIDPSEFSGDTLEGIALGAFSAYGPTGPNSRSLFDLVSKLKQVAASQNAPTVASKYVSELLKDWEPSEQLSILNRVQAAINPQTGASR